MITAKVICDSVNTYGNRLTTFELRYPKFIHGECKTHRVMRIGDEGGYELMQEVGLMNDPHLSRNASSSRAIPTERLLAEVRSDLERATPVFWGKNQKGMQAAEELSDVLETEPTEHWHARTSPRQSAKNQWREAALSAAKHAEQLVAIGAHKQIVNRILEPFTHINVVCSATEYDNFFGLRLHADAQPEARALASAMWEARARSNPQLLMPGEWHLPYIPTMDSSGRPIKWKEGLDDIDTVRKVSTARCGRVSYRSFETGRESEIPEDIKLHDRLLAGQPLHASPAEHQATPDHNEQPFGPMDRPSGGGWQHREEWGNLVGWCQYRKMIPGEAVAPLPDEYRHSPDV